MVAGNHLRKVPAFGAGLPYLLLRSPKRSRACLDGIEQRPVALVQRVALGKRCAQFEAERAQHAVIAVVALQNDTDERRRRTAACGAELDGYRIASGCIELGQRLAGKTREMIERLRNQRGVAAERRQ